MCGSWGRELQCAFDVHIGDLNPMDKPKRIYQNKNGSDQELTEEEFQEVVDVFRTLLKWDQELKAKKQDENQLTKSNDE